MSKVSTLRRNGPSSLDAKSLHEVIDHIEDYNEKIYAAAIWYGKNNFHIIPFMPYGYPKGLSQKHATANLKLINKWWDPKTGDYPGAAIAMAHGGKAGFCAIDLDQKADVDGIQNLADLQLAYGDYDDGEGEGLQTLMAMTPSGGRHLIFKYHPEIISNSEFSYPGIDTRGGLKRNPVENGGITFVEPSRKPKSEGFYRWDPSITQIIDMPQWLVEILNGRKPAPRGGIKLQDSYIQSASGDHGDGRDRNIYMDLMRFVGIGYNEDQLWALMPDILDRMDPPDEGMVRRKIESAIQSEAFTKSKDKQKEVKQISTLALARDSKDRIIKSVDNLRIILESPIFEYEYGEIRYDKFTQQFVLSREPMNSVANWAVGIQLWIARKFQLDYGTTTVREQIEFMAYSYHDHINIARDYMMSCPKPAVDGVENFMGSKRKGPGPAFRRLCTEVLDLNNKKLHTDYTTEIRDAYIAFLWFWLQGVAARVCVPGCKMEIVLNIFGHQGIGKSLFFMKLCPDHRWFTDSIQDSIAGGGQNNRDELLKLKAKMIVEMPELNPVKRGGKSGDDKMKQFISTQEDNYRRAYGHDSIDHPRTCALCGTSNNNDVYRDSTGDRRFISIDHGEIPIRVGDIDNGVIDEIRDSLWGELVDSFGPSELNKPSDKLIVAIPPDLRPMQTMINKSHKFEEIGVNIIIEWAQDKSRFTWADVLAYAKTIPGLRDAKESMIISMVRKELSNDKNFKLKSNIKITNAEGEVERASRVWVNNNLDMEKEHHPGMPVPPHWSEYGKLDPLDDREPKY